MGGFCVKKWYNLLYMLCWCCLAWGLTVAIPHEYKFFAGSFMEQDSVWIRYLLPFLILLVMCFLLWLNLHLTATQTKKFYRIQKVASIAVLFGCGEIFYRCFSYAAVQLGWSMGIAMLVMLITIGIFLARNSKTLEAKRNTIVGEMIVLICAAVGLTLWVPGMWGISVPAVSIPGGLLEHYIGQLSLTFITISVMSVLSDKSVIIYWENVAEAKLIRPLFGSFAAFTGYSIASTVCAGISVLLDNDLAFACFFALNTVILILLTLTMVDVYYGREQKKADRAKLLRQVSSNRERESIEEYRKLMQSLQYHLYQHIEEHDIPFVREVAELYGSNIECFDTEEGQQIKKLLSSELDLVPVIVSGIRSRVQEMEQEHDSVNALVKGIWREDHLLWSWLAKKENLSALVVNDAIHTSLLMITLNRMTLLVNDILRNKVPFYAPAIRFYDRKRRYSALKLRRSIMYLEQFVQMCIMDDKHQTSQEKRISRKFIADLMYVLHQLKTNVPLAEGEQIEKHLAYIVFANNPKLAVSKPTSSEPE